MKKYLFLLLTLVSCTAFASQNSPTQPDKAVRWVQSMIEQGTTVVSGKTPKGEPCGLHLRDTQDGSYYVVVSPTAATVPSRANEFVGLRTDKSKSIVNSYQISFHSNESWGNWSSWNSVTIVFGGIGEPPTTVVGVSDLTKITCKLDSEASWVSIPAPAL